MIKRILLFIVVTILLIVAFLFMQGGKYRRLCNKIDSHGVVEELSRYPLNESNEVPKNYWGRLTQEFEPEMVVRYGNGFWLKTDTDGKYHSGPLALPNGDESALMNGSGISTQSYVNGWYWVEEKQR